MALPLAGILAPPILAAVLLAGAPVARGDVPAAAAGEDSQEALPPEARGRNAYRPAVWPTDEDYLRWPLPEGAERYGAIDGSRIKADVNALSAISRRSGTGGKDPPARMPVFMLGNDDGNRLREAIEYGRSPRLRVELAVEHREGLRTASVWGVLPGMSNEQITVMAHTDAFFDGAMENGSGLGTLLELARFYAAQPAGNRPRTMTFFTTSAHHAYAGEEAGIVWIQRNRQDLLQRTALYAEPERRPGGELSKVYRDAPGVHIIDHAIYHTDLDTPERVPTAGLEAAARAFARIIDEANGLSFVEIRGETPEAAQ